MDEGEKPSDINITGLLVTNNLNTNPIASLSQTPLHIAALQGHKEVVVELIKNKESTKSLIDNGTDVNTKPNDKNSLVSAIGEKNKEIVQVLITNGADVNEKNGSPLLKATNNDNKEIVNFLLRNNASVNLCPTTVQSPAAKGFKDLIPTQLETDLKSNKDIEEKVEDLFKDLENLKKYLENGNFKNETPQHSASVNENIVCGQIPLGADVNPNFQNVIPLCLSPQDGHIVRILTENGATIDALCTIGAPLPIAAGQNNIVFLLESKANIFDSKSEEAVELEVSKGQLPKDNVVLEHPQSTDVITKNMYDLNLSQIAPQERSEDMTKNPVEKEADARNKPSSIPIAENDSHLELLKYYLGQEMSTDDFTIPNETMLQYASKLGHQGVVDYLLEKGSDINMKDKNDFTPLLLTHLKKHEDKVEYNLNTKGTSTENSFPKMQDMTGASEFDIPLEPTQKLFRALKQMNVLEVADAIKEGAEVNARNKLKKTPLHIASHKGDNEIVALLLQNKADPQMSDINEYTPLHYAAEASNLKMVEALLSHGAIYNATTMDGATPCKFASDEKIVFLLNLLEDSFRHIKNGSEQVISDLKILKDVKQVRAVMCANNREHETLIVCAIKTNFPKVNCLKEILQENVSGRIDHARNLIGWCRYRESIDILMSIHEERREILGPENPGTWDIQYYIALGLYNQGSILEALGIVTDIYKKRRDTLGTDAEDTLRTRSLQASMLYSLKQDDEALSIFKEIYPTHKKLLGVNHEVVVDNLLHIGVILEAQEKYDEALKIYEELYQLRKETLGGDAPVTLSAQNKIAIILHKQGKYEKTLKVLQEVYERRKVVFGEEHTVTLETLKNIGSSFMWQRKVHEALKVFKDLLTIQKKVFGPMDYYTLSTQSLLGSIYASQGKWSSAQVEFSSCLDQMKYVYAQNHPSVLNILKKLEMVQMALKKQVDQYVDATQGLQDFSDMATNTENRQGVGPTVKSSVGKNKSPDQLYPLHHAVIMGNLEAVNVLLKDGTNANSRDSEGRTPLHHAVDKSNTNIVKILKQHGADVTLATNEGSTSLHTAAIKRAQEIAELLLKDLPPKNLKYFVNAKTSVRGMTALHISAERGYVEMILILLSHGAVYNIPDKQGNTPVDLSIDKDIVVLLSLIDELFNDAKIGNMDILGKLKLAKPVLFNALANSRNHQGNTLLQVAIANKNKNLAGQLMILIKKNTV